MMYHKIISVIVITLFCLSYVVCCCWLFGFPTSLLLHIISGSGVS